MEANSNPPDNLWDEFRQEVVSGLEQSRQALNEVTLMLDQSQSELAKLTQRNATITGHLQQVQSQFESIPRNDIQTAYNAALDAQQRLLVMRGQLEKLQSDQGNLKRFVYFLEKMDQLFKEGSGPTQLGRGSGNKTAMLEMVMGAQESERQRLSRQMHDGPAQALSNFIVQTEIVNKLFDIDPLRAKEELEHLKDSAMGTFQQVRGFIFELRPMMLDDLGLIPTLTRYVDGLKQKSGVEIGLSIKGQQRRLEPFLEAMVFRAYQELIGNAIRINKDQPGKLQVNALLYVDEKLVKVSVNDNGKGYDPNELADDGGLGMKLIRERVEMLGGVMEVDSAQGRGTNVNFQVPSIEIEPI